ncbi:hypothetical protein GCM10010987_27910 [Bradyrhizobium guangdongense]|uniref:Uncharacterized protein n=1 Tax=Bradyrhizobium guangdongense TaxID=1325090 RepID=A0A410V7B5_9BRAD|nr:hypothetical protein X265_19440 [Bradyrhizobium guangdongense]QOZ60654.1 hypothetical protein XH86_19450 [Bradyrhizobium guangdongense]GGI24143.1 hypothetical protein GCM10010987_27910 [Bradyrhizobium guangdongense]
MSRALERFRELVREQRAALPRKERNASSVYEVASLRQVMEQTRLELAAGIKHDERELAGVIALANEKVAAAPVNKPGKARFRGLGR